MQVQICRRKNVNLLITLPIGTMQVFQTSPSTHVLPLLGLVPSVSLCPEFAKFPNYPAHSLALIIGNMPATPVTSQCHVELACVRTVQNSASCNDNNTTDSGKDVSNAEPPAAQLASPDMAEDLEQSYLSPLPTVAIIRKTG